MSDTKEQSSGEMVQDTPLTIREHLDPDKHLIGEALAPPTQSEIAATVGNISGPGDSPFVARADHLHKLGTGVVTAANIADGAVTDAKLTNDKVNVGGDTMLGFLSLAANPTLAMHSVTKQYVDSRFALLRSRFSRGDTAYAASTTFTLAYSVNSEVSGPSGVTISQSAGSIIVPVDGTYSLSLWLNPTAAWGSTNTVSGTVVRTDIGQHFLNIQTLQNTSVGVLTSWVLYLTANDTLSFSFGNNSASSVTMSHYAEVALITPDLR